MPVNLKLHCTLNSDSSVTVVTGWTKKSAMLIDIRGDYYKHQDVMLGMS